MGVTMIKEIHIIYCEGNEKYDLYIDGKFLGKFYELETAIKSLRRETETPEQLSIRMRETLKRMKESKERRDKLQS